MYKISLKVNVLAFIFRIVGRIHLQIILRNKNLIFKIFVFKTPSFTEDHVVATKMVWLKGEGFQTITTTQTRCHRCTKNEEILNGKLHFLCSVFLV